MNRMRTSADNHKSGSVFSVSRGQSLWSQVLKQITLFSLNDNIRAFDCNLNENLLKKYHNYRNE
jgi:hypothetical protein